MYIRQWGEKSRPRNLTGVWVCMYGGGGGDTINHITNPGIRKSELEILVPYYILLGHHIISEIQFLHLKTGNN